jgi:hypothetical protein
VYAGISKKLSDLLINSPSIEKHNVVEVATPAAPKAALTPNSIYTFSQGGGAYGAGRNFSGEWSQKGVSGNKFGAFGCGLTDMAGIYSTLSPYEISPWGMLEFAKAHTSYYPTGSAGAIEWGQMQDALSQLGIKSSFFQDTGNIADFRNMIATNKVATVLIAGDTNLFHTKGHYINIWLYNPADDTVFLGDPGNFENNRTRVALSDVYKVIKGGSAYQSLAVSGYDESANTTKANGIEENWIRPDYLVDYVD